MKARGANQPGGKTKQPAPIDASNVMLVCPECGKATKVAHDKSDGKNVRKCKKCGAVIDVKAAKKATAKKTKKSVKKSTEEPAAEQTANEEVVETAPKAKKATRKTATKKTAPKADATETEVK